MTQRLFHLILSPCPVGGGGGKRVTGWGVWHLPMSDHHTMLETETHSPLVQSLHPACSLSSGSWWRSYVLCGLTYVLYNIWYFSNNLYQLPFQFPSYSTFLSIWIHNICLLLLKQQKSKLYQQLPKRIRTAPINTVLYELTTLKHIFLWVFLKIF